MQTMQLLIVLALFCKLVFLQETLIESIKDTGMSLSFTTKSLFPAATNYQCSDATPITLGSTSFNNTDASSDSFTLCNEPTSKLIWYVWQATFTGFLQVSTFNSADFDTVLAVYTSCENFPANYVGCNGQYESSTSLLNIQVNIGQNYFIALGGYNGDSGSGTLKLSQATLSLTSVTVTGTGETKQVNFVATTTATDNIRIAINLTCESTTTFSGGFLTSLSVQQANLPGSATSSCYIQAVDSNNSSLVSNSVTLPSLVISQPENGANWPVNKYLPILVSYDSSATGTDSIVTFTCPSGQFTETVQINQTTNVQIPSSYGTDTCSLVASSTTFFFESLPVSITFTVPVYITTNFNNWQGGTTVPIQVSAFNGALISLKLNIDCTTSSQSFDITTSASPQNLNLSASLNGLTCSVTGRDLPPNYLIDKPLIRTVSLGTVALKEFLRSILVIF